MHVAIPQIEWRGVHYSVPPRCLGQKVEVRHEVDSSTIEIRWAGEVVGRHTVADPMTGEVWDAGHWQAAQQAALGRSRGRHLVGRPPRRTARAGPVPPRHRRRRGRRGPRPLPL